MHRVFCLALSSALLLAASACRPGTTPGGTTASPAAAADPLDQATADLLASLGRGDYAALQKRCANPLCHDLSAEEFADLAKIVGWLGTVQERATTDTDDTYGGGQRWYELRFEKGERVDLEVSIDAKGQLVGFEFDGPGFADAERGALSEAWLEFKVYDFKYLDADGQPLPDEAPIVGTKVDYEVVVGGIEAFVGEHHLKLEKIVFDASGKEVFHEPVEFDTKFAADATGIPRGVVRGFLDVPGPGAWTMELRITDQVAHRDIEYRHDFKTVASK